VAPLRRNIPLRNKIGAAGRIALPFFRRPRIYHREFAVFEILDIARCEGQAIAERGSCDETVDDRHAATGFFRLCLQNGPITHFFFAERQNAPGKSGK